MLKIKGLSESQITEIVNKVANNHKGKAFGCYTDEDIQQEVWIIALKALKSPNGFKHKKAKVDNVGQALENWLNIVVSRRLKNFYRDKYLVPQKELQSDKNEFAQKKRQLLMHPVDIGLIDESNILNNWGEMSPTENLFFEMLLPKLDVYLYDTLETILSGETVACYYKNKLYQIIKDTWGEYEARTQNIS